MKCTKKRSRSPRARRASSGKARVQTSLAGAMRAENAARFSLVELQHIADRVIEFSEADETEIEIDSTTDALTRFANNTIHQNVAEHMLAISVRAVMDGRTARATTNKTDEESLRRVADAAIRLARNEPKTTHLLPLLG